MSKMTLYHAGYLEIPEPDVHYGRKNADLGQGFYTSDNRDFSLRWVKEMKDRSPVLNVYELKTEGLTIKRFERTSEWFDYIKRNRRGQGDNLKDVDIIIGPIANDTLYNTLGILTSGLLTEEQSLKILMQGNAYDQIVLKTEKAAENLTFLGILKPDHEEILKAGEALKKEQEAFLSFFEDLMED